MQNRISILWISGAPTRKERIPFAAFRDCGLTSLLSEDTVRLLCTPCAGNELIARQEVFRALEAPAVAELFEQIYTSLCAWEKRKVQEKETEHLPERYWHFLRLFDCYLALLNTASALETESRLLNGLKQYAAERLEALQSLLPLLEEYRGILRTLSACSLAVRRGHPFLVMEEKESGIFDSLLRSAEALGFLSGERRDASLGLSEALQIALMQANPERFDRLQELTDALSAHVDVSLLRLKPEVCFYRDVRGMLAKMEARRVPCCYPRVAATPLLEAKNLYNVALFSADRTEIVPNDASFSPEEHLFFVTGANGGGKTTYLKTIVLNLLLFLGGCPIFGQSAEIYPFSCVYTHFPVDETEGSGRLAEEERRVQRILEELPPDAFVFLNETFTGANEEIGMRLSLQTMRTLREKGAFVLFVTHFHALETEEFPVLSAVVEENGHKRLYRIRRSDAMESSYARDILEMHGLDERSLQEYMKTYREAHRRDRGET